jgi:PBP1b-binding outer membrane lipoprotein LpoB
MKIATSILLFAALSFTGCEKTDTATPDDATATPETPAAPETPETPETPEAPEGDAPAPEGEAAPPA